MILRNFRTRKNYAVHVELKVRAYRLRKPVARPADHSRKPSHLIAFSPHACACTTEAERILKSDLSHHHAVPALARKVGLNTSTLQACFKQLYGKTLFEYGQDIRLEHGKKLLHEIALAIQEIAEACGYPEQANFSAAFKKKYGMAPGAWRKENGQPDMGETNPDIRRRF